MSSAPSAVQTHPAVAEEMALIHRILRQGLTELRRLVGDVPPVATGRARAVADHIGFSLDGLHGHHTTEDELIWPMVRERVDRAGASAERMEDQHRQIGDAVREVRLRLEPWAAAPTAQASAGLGTSLGGLLDVLEPHLDEEERDVVPLIAGCVTEEEWENFGRTAFEKFRPAQRFIAMGQLLEHAGLEEAAAMFAKVPGPVRVLWRTIGKRQYNRRMDAVRGKPLNGALRLVAPLITAVPVRIYTRSDGRRGGTAKGLPLLLVTVPGRRTGIPRTTVVVYFQHDGGYLVCASSGGMAPEPQWFRNLRCASEAQIQVGASRHDVRVRFPERAERDRLWSDVVLAQAPIFAHYERKAARLIPLALLTPS